MGPFNLPWSTFLAFLVILGSVAGSIFWAVNEKRQEKTGKVKK